MQQPFPCEEVLDRTNLEIAREKIGLLFWPRRSSPVSPQSGLDAWMWTRHVRGIAVIDVACGIGRCVDAEVASGTLDSCYAVVMPLSGSAVIGCGEQEIRAVPGVAALAIPSEQLTIRCAAGTALRAVAIQEIALRAQLTEIAGRSIERAFEFVREVDLGDGAGRIFAEEVARMVALLERDADAFAQPLAAAATEQTIMARLVEAAGQADTTVPDPGPARPRIVREAVELIEEHPEWEHTVNSLADEVRASRRALERAFRKHTGMSPWKYVKSVRLSKARDQLQAGDPHGLTVGEVARRWGMTHSQFSADYHRVYGETPVQTLQASC